MTKRSGRMAGVILGLLVSAGLSFGASELFAARTLDCGPGYHGTCSTQQECEDLCLVLFPNNGGIGTCEFNNCCRCAER